MALQESDDRTQFRSGDEDLDRFLHKYAGQNQFRHHIGTTYVALEKRPDRRVRDRGSRTSRSGGPPAGSAGEVSALPPSDPALGKRLLRFILHLSLRMAADFGCTGVVVDAKPDAVPFYEQFGFEPLDVIEGQSLARPAATAMFLPLREIASAIK